VTEFKSAHYSKRTERFRDHLTEPESSTSSQGGDYDVGPKVLKRWRWCRRKLTEARLLPSVDDFGLFDVSHDETLKLKFYTVKLLI